MIPPSGTKSALVLVVDDEPLVRELLGRLLRTDGYEVIEAPDGEAAIELVRLRQPDIVLLDVMLPSRDGLDVLSELRASSNVPVILVTSRDTETDRVVGLRMGADDYVGKPFSAAELSARVESVLRRSGDGRAGGARRPTTDRRLAFTDLVIDRDTREVHLGGRRIDTTVKEFDLLVVLAMSPRHVFSRQHLLDQVWNSSSDWQSDATVTEHVRRLRRKIEEDPEHPRRVVTVRGVGYRFEP